MRVQRSEGETWTAAQEQIALLVSACRRFDEGDRLEYLSIASKLRILLRQARQSHAVLAQVDLLDKPIYVASGADLTPENVAPESALTYTSFGGDGPAARWYFPRLDDLGETPPAKMLPLNIQIHRKSHGIVVRDGGRGRAFDDWWLQPVVRDAQRTEFSRSDLVLKVANQDGGDHVDPALDARHYGLTRLNTMGMFKGSDPMESPVPATIRQIGWEVHSMLWEHSPDLVALAANPEPAVRSWG